MSYREEIAETRANIKRNLAVVETQEPAREVKPRVHTEPVPEVVSFLQSLPRIPHSFAQRGQPVCVDWHTLIRGVPKIHKSGDFKGQQMETEDGEKLWITPPVPGCHSFREILVSAIEAGVVNSEGHLR